MKRIQFFRTKGRACLAILLGVSLLTLCLILAFGTSQKTQAANTVLWTEVDPPGTSGTFPSLVQGDINEDGHIDLIAGSLGYGIRGVTGHGDGTWTPLGSAITTLGTWNGLALGDVNNDGKLDLVGAENSAGIYIWTGDGAGGWMTMTSPAVAGSFWSVALSDIDNDGNLDIAAGSGGDAGLRVWTGDGAGGWVSISTGLPVAGDYADVALGDVDRDGRPDLVAASHVSGVRAWRWNGISWTEHSGGLLPSGDYYGVALGDLDNDGDLDIVASGDGVGVRAWTVSVDIIWNWSDASAGLPGIDDQYWDVGLSDVNNDGRLDIAATSYVDGIGVWLGNGGTAWSEQSTGLPTSGSYYGLALGDFDDDGMVDLSAGQNAGVQAWVDDGTPEAMEGWQQITSPTTDDVHRGVDVGDFDRDGKLDVVAATVGDGLQLWTGDGGNTWTDVASWTVPDLPDTGTYHTPALVDIDNDGDLDVIVSRGTAGGIQVWRFLGPGWYEASTGLPPTGTFGDLDTGDFNNDGYVDFVAIGQGQGIKAWTGNGGIDWTLTATGLPGSATFYSVALGDVDRDGNLDIVAGSDGSGIGVWQSTGTDWVSRPPYPTDEGSWWGIALGDVNDDGDLDIVAAADDNGVAVWAGDGDFGWTPLTANPAASGDFWGLDLGDYNNDGALDVAAGTSDGKGILVWAGDGGTSWLTYTTNLPTTGTYPAVRFGEIDNDGYLDLVGAKQGTGSIHAWTGAEGAPPSGWANFSPDGWIASRDPMTLSIEVLDSGSGLNPNSAQYSTWEREGATWDWSSWKPADCTGSPGVTTTQTISAVGVVFPQDSGPAPHTRNRIRFRVSDLAGNTGYSGAYIVHIDTVPPTNPTSFPDSSHDPGGAWLDDDTVWVDWDDEAFDETSGVEGYSFVFSKTYELPDTVRDTRFSEATSDPPLGDGEWYIGVRTQDKAGNWAPDAVYEGPFRIDTLPPTNPTDFDSDPHRRMVWSNINRINIDWSGANDDGSGVFGYNISWTEGAYSSPDQWTTETYTTSPSLADGDSWYFHLRTQDRAENWASNTVHWGPFYIDTIPPHSIVDSPSTSASRDFYVSWDAWELPEPQSGIDDVTVMYRERCTTSWETWLTNRVASGGDTFTGEHGRAYEFVSVASDEAGNVETWSGTPDSTTEVNTIDFEAFGLEVTQATQDLNNSVVLVADKRTFARFHVRSLAHGNQESVSAELTAWRDGVRLGTIPPNNPGGTITVREHPDRGALDHSFYFDLPSSWLHGSVLLIAEVNPGPCLAESDYDNNRHAESVTFYDSPEMNLLLVDVCYTLSGTTYHVRNTDRRALASWLRRAYPIHRLNVWWGTLATCYADASVDADGRLTWPDSTEVNETLAWNHSRGVLGDGEDPYTRYYGMVDDGGGFMRGAGQRPGTVASGPAGSGNWGWDFDGSYADWYGGHELGHTYNQSHTRGTQPPSCPADCGCEGGAVDHYPDGDISPTRVGSDPDAIYGFDVDTLGIYPSNWKDVMTYCDNLWVSDYTYEGIRDRMVAESGVADLRMRRAAQEYLAVFGTIYSPTNQVELGIFYRVPEAWDVLGRVPGEYSIRLLDEGGNSLADYPFTPRFSYVDSGPACRSIAQVEQVPGLIAEYVPWVTDTVRIAIYHDTQELASRLVSANAPQVALITPNGGEALNGDQITIAWEASDADSDALEYTLEYSVDGGVHWRVLGSGITTTDLLLDAATVPGSDQGKFRILASDGVNVGQDESDGTFTVPNKAPEAWIASPSNMATYVPGQTVALVADSIDLEDGTLDGASLTWTSSLSGTVGMGQMLHATDLVTGTHVITLTVTDSDGGVATDTVTIFVGVSPNKIYLPLVLR